MTRPVIPFPVQDACPSCPVATKVAVHTTQISYLEETSTRIEGKLDRLLWWIMGTCAAAAGALLTMLLKK